VYVVIKLEDEQGELHIVPEGPKDKLKLDLLRGYESSLVKRGLGKEDEMIFIFTDQKAPLNCG
jgi:hypothetical protein